ncbi:hypothetical protein SPURM210S_06244 [Streptomyces purpurascens]
MSLTPARSKYGSSLRAFSRGSRPRAPDFLDPLFGAREDSWLPVAEVRPVTGPQLGQRGRGGAEVLDAAVDQVADDRDQVGLGRVDRVDDRLREAAAQDRAEVDVADHRDPEAVRRARQLGQRHRDPLHLRTPQHAVRAVPHGPDSGGRGGPGDDPRDEEAAGGAGGGGGCGAGGGGERLRGGLRGVGGGVRPRVGPGGGGGRSAAGAGLCGGRRRGSRCGTGRGGDAGLRVDHRPGVSRSAGHPGTAAHLRAGGRRGSRRRGGGDRSASGVCLRGGSRRCTRRCGADTGLRIGRCPGSTRSARCGRGVRALVGVQGRRGVCLVRSRRRRRRSGPGPRSVPAFQEPPQQGAYDLARHHRQQQVYRQGQPQEARPGEGLLEPEGGAGAFGDQGRDRQGPAPGDQDRARAAGEARAAGRVAEQAAPHVPVGRHDDGQDQQCDEYEDDGHGVVSPDCRYDVRRSARRPRNPMAPTTVPNTKDTTASNRCTQKYAVG